MTRPLDLICMGRAAVDLYSEQIGTPLEDATSFAKYVGGCPANVAIGAARLGLRTAMLSRVGDEAMGRFVSSTLRSEGVDTRLLQTDPHRLTGLVLLGVLPPDHFPLIFYREDCADMAIDPELFSEEDFSQAQALLITGTHCSQEYAFDVTNRAVESALRAGCQLILDIDYRPVLWGAVGAGAGEERAIGHPLVSERLREILPSCSVIVGTEEELCVATGKESADAAVSSLRERTSALIVRKRGRDGCIVYAGGSPPLYGTPYPVEVLNVLGAGDAFLAGFLRGYLRDEPLEQCCRYANANGAIVVTRHGCSPAMARWNELADFIGARI